MMISLASSFGLPELGGSAGIGVAALYGLQQLFAWLNGRRTHELTEESQHTVATSAAVADAATANAVLLRVNEALHSHVERVEKANLGLQDVIAEKDRIINETQAEVERLMTKMATLYQTLEELKSK